MMKARRRLFALIVLLLAIGCSEEQEAPAESTPDPTGEGSTEPATATDALRTGELALHTEVDGTRLFANGVYVGDLRPDGPLTLRLKPATYQLRASRDGCEDLVADVAVEVGVRKTIDVQLDATPTRPLVYPGRVLWSVGTNVRGAVGPEEQRDFTIQGEPDERLTLVLERWVRGLRIGTVDATGTSTPLDIERKSLPGIAGIDRCHVQLDAGGRRHIRVTSTAKAGRRYFAIRNMTPLQPVAGDAKKPTRRLAPRGIDPATGKWTGVDRGRFLW